MGGPKALAVLDGESFVARAARMLREGGCSDVVVVVGPPHASRVTATLTGVEVTHNDEPSRGMLSSLQLGLARVREKGGAAAVVALLDHPRVAPTTVAALIGAWRDGDATLVRPVYEGRHGHPYLVDRALFEALDRAPHAEGARPVMRAAHPSTDVEVDDAAVHEDVDTPDEAWAVGASLPDE